MLQHVQCDCAVWLWQCSMALAVLDAINLAINSVSSVYASPSGNSALDRGGACIRLKRCDLDDMNERTSESLATSRIVRCLLACGPGGVAAIAAAASAGLAPRAGEITGRDFEAGTFRVLQPGSSAPVGSSMSLLGASVAPLLGLRSARAGSCAGATRLDFSASRAEVATCDICELNNSLEQWRPIASVGSLELEACSAAPPLTLPG